MYLLALIPLNRIATALSFIGLILLQLKDKIARPFACMTVILFGSSIKCKTKKHRHSILYLQLDFTQVKMFFAIQVDKSLMPFVKNYIVYTDVIPLFCQILLEFRNEDRFFYFDFVCIFKYFYCYFSITGLHRHN